MGVNKKAPFVGHKTLVDILKWRAFEQPNHTGYTFLSDGESKEEILTYRELDRRARFIASYLQSFGSPGDRVMILLPPGKDFISAYFGCLYAGMIAILLYPPSRAHMDKTMDRLVGAIKDSEPVGVLTNQSIKDFSPQLFELSQELASLPWTALEDIPEGLENEWKPTIVKPDDLAFLQYTSGSTSRPKGVKVSHGNLMHNSSCIQKVFGSNADSVGVIWLPPYHDMGLIGGIIQPLYGGFPVVLIPPFYFLQRPFRWLKAITEYKASVSGGPNFAYDYCVKKIRPDQLDQLDLSSWKLAFNGAEPINPVTIRNFAQHFASCGFSLNAFSPCYGMAETTLIVSGHKREAPPIIKSFEASALERNELVEIDESLEGGRALVSSGKISPDMKVEIIDPETFIRTPQNRIGEIWVSGPSITKGYWARPEASKEAFGAYIADTNEGPFLRTGDLGFMWKGELFITGRLKDLIIVDGSNHYPQDIEWTAENSHEAIKSNCVAAFSIPKKGAEKLVLQVEIDRRILKSTPGLEEKDIGRAIRSAISKHHDLRVYDVVFLKSRIPKTTSGKIKRQLCRKNYLEAKRQIPT